jgi:hypothetical protein
VFMTRMRSIAIYLTLAVAPRQLHVSHAPHVTKPCCSRLSFTMSTTQLQAWPRRQSAPCNLCQATQKLRRPHLRSGRWSVGDTTPLRDVSGSLCTAHGSVCVFKLSTMYVCSRTAARGPGCLAEFLTAWFYKDWSDN